MSYIWRLFHGQLNELCPVPIGIIFESQFQISIAVPPNNGLCLMLALELLFFSTIFDVSLVIFRRFPQLFLMFFWLFLTLLRLFLGVLPAFFVFFCFFFDVFVFFFRLILTFLWSILGVFPAIFDVFFGYFWRFFGYFWAFSRHFVSFLLFLTFYGFLSVREESWPPGGLAEKWEA